MKCYESSGFFYYLIDSVPERGRPFGIAAAFDFKETALPFKIGWIQSSGGENILVSCKTKLVRVQNGGSGRYVQLAVDPSEESVLVHDPYTAPQGSTVVVTVGGLV